MTVAGAAAGTGRAVRRPAARHLQLLLAGPRHPAGPRGGGPRPARRAHPARSSLGEVNGHLFLNNVSIGIYPAILRAREDVYRRWGRRRIAAHWSVAKTFVAFQRPLHLTLTADGRTWKAKTPLLFAARSAYQLESFGLAGADCVAGGQFAVYVAPDMGRAGLFLEAMRLARGAMQEGRDFDLTCTESMTIASRSRHLTVACDGEKFRMRTPLTLRHAARRPRGAGARGAEVNADGSIRAEEADALPPRPSRRAEGGRRRAARRRRRHEAHPPHLGPALRPHAGPTSSTRWWR